MKKLGPLRIGLCLVFGGTLATVVFFLTFNWGLSFIFAAPLLTLDWRQVHIDRASAAGLPFDTRSWREVWKDCGYESCQPFINPLEELTADKDGLPIAPWPRQTKVVHCNEGGRWIVTNNDRFGFRGNAASEHAWSDAVLLGDSFVQGACVEEPQSIAGYLRAEGKTILNLGVADQGPLGELAVLKEYLERSETLVWFFFEGNDYLKGPNSIFLKQYLQAGFSQGDKSKASLTDGRFLSLVNAKRLAPEPNLAAQADVRRVYTLLNFFAPLRSFYQYAMGQVRPVPPLEFDAQLFREILLEARRFGADKGVKKFVFVYLPGYYRYAWRPAAHPELTVYGRIHAEALAAAQTTGWRIVDLRKDFEAAGDPLSFFVFRSRAHYTPEGYRAVARAVGRELN